MSFVLNANPLKGTLCVPYYYLWLTIIFSWSLTLIEYAYMQAMQFWQGHIMNKPRDFEIRINQKMLAIMESELRKIEINYNALPNEIILTIMSMLPKRDKAYVDLSNHKYKRIQYKSALPPLTAYLYPLARFVCNFINFVMLLIRYSKWYDDNDDLSNWRKYCALIIIMFYMPICKGRGVMRLIQLPWGYGEVLPVNHEEIIWWQPLYWFEMVSDVLFAFWLIILTFPIAFSGAFIFIPTTIILGCSLCVLGVALWGISYLILKHIFNLNNRDTDYQAAMVATSWTLTFWTIWAFTTIIFSTMEFYGNKEYDWIESWKTGFSGTYCDEDDYLIFYRFNQYDWDIQLLVVSWFMF